jgi:hypothetical protein
MTDNQPDRLELFVSEEDTAREPLAARIAELLYETGSVIRVDAEGRAVDEHGEFTEGDWDERQEKYYPHAKPGSDEGETVQSTSDSTKRDETVATTRKSATTTSKTGGK